METISIRNGLKDDWVQLAGREMQMIEHWLFNRSVVNTNEKQTSSFLFAAVQMAHAGQLTLELPYVIIGLGATPNFVEKLTIGLPPNVQSVRSCRLVPMKSSLSLSVCLEPPDSNLYSDDS